MVDVPSDVTEVTGLLKQTSMWPIEVVEEHLGGVLDELVVDAAENQDQEEWAEKVFHVWYYSKGGAIGISAAKI